jgi:hypothetical protein
VAGQDHAVQGGAVGQVKTIVVFLALYFHLKKQECFVLAHWIIRLALMLTIDRNGS